MGFLDYENYDDTGHLSANFAHNGDSTIDVVEFDPRDGSGLLFNETESNMGDCLFDFNGPGNLRIRAYLDPRDKKLMKKAFRYLVISYHASVRESMLESLSALYNRKHYMKLGYDSLVLTWKWVPLIRRNRRLSALLNDAERYSLRECLYRWRFYAITRNEARAHEATARVFHETALCAKCLSAFKALARQSALKKYKVKATHSQLTRMAAIVDRLVSSNVLDPWVEATKRLRRLDLCHGDIADNRDRYVALALQGAQGARVRAAAQGVQPAGRGLRAERERASVLEKGRVRAAVPLLQPHGEGRRGATRRSRRSWSAGFSCSAPSGSSTTGGSSRSTSSPRTRTGAASRRGRSAACKPLAQFSTRYKNARAAKKALWNAVSGELDRLRLERAFGEIQTQCAERTATRKALAAMAAAAEACLARRGWATLYGHHRAIQKELDDNAKAERFLRHRAFKRALGALLAYAHRRRAKREKMLLAEVSYKRYLLSVVFSHMLELHRERERTERALLDQFRKRADRALKREVLHAMRAVAKRLSRLADQHDSIWSRYNVYLATTAFRTFQHVIQLNNRRKAGLVRAILGRDEPGDHTPELSQERVPLRMLLSSTKPLKSEALTFLLHLLSLKARYAEVFQAHFASSDDELVLRVMHGMTGEQLAQIKAKYALLLHETRLAFISQTETYRQSPEAYLNTVPPQVEHLLQYATLQQVFNLGDRAWLQDSEGSEGAVSGYALLKLPLWRLINLKFVAAKRRIALATWRALTAARIRRRAEDAEFFEHFGEIHTMFTKIQFFKAWSELTGDVIERRNVALVQRWQHFSGRLEFLVSNRRALAYVALRLNQLSAAANGIELNGRARTWFANFLRNNPDFTHAQGVFRFLRAHEVFVNWLNYSLWHAKIKRDADEFNRINTLVKTFKAWFTATVYLNSKRQQLGQTIKFASDSILKYVTFDALYTLSRLYRLVDRRNAGANLLRRAFGAWLGYTATLRALRARYVAIRDRAHFELWQAAAARSARDRNLAAMAEDHFYVTTADKCLAAWLAVTRRRAWLRDAADMIADLVTQAAKIRVLRTLHRYSYIARLDRAAAAERALSAMVTKAFAMKLGRALEHAQARETVRAVREFFALLRAHRGHQRAVEAFVKARKSLLPVLFRLSDINRDRAVQGLRILNANAYYRTRLKLIRSRRNALVLLKYFEHWRSLAASNAHWLDRLELAETRARGGPAGPAPELSHPKFHQLRLVRLRHQLGLCREAIGHWKRAVGVLAADPETLAQAYSFAQSSRLLQALRALEENILERRWRAVCEFRALEIEHERDFNLKARVFAHLKALVKPTLEQLLSVDALSVGSESPDSELGTADQDPPEPSNGPQGPEDVNLVH